jgi:hypothetical protein
MVAQGNSAAFAKTGPPKFLNMVHQELKPGHAGAYDETLTSIVRTYNRENIPAFWLLLHPVIGPSELLGLNLFDSSEDMDKTTDALSAALMSRPKLVQMQDRLLQDNISNETTVLGVRRDDMGYRANSVDFSKMRMLRLTTILIHPGYERPFMEAQWSMAGAAEKIHAQTAWVVYEVTAGIPQPSFVIVTLMQGFKDIEDILATNQALRTSEGGALQDQLQELARIAYGTTDSRIFAVNPATSHVSKEFAAGDPDFWAPATLSAPPSGTTKNEKGSPKGPRPAAPKP